VRKLLGCRKSSRIDEEGVMVGILVHGNNHYILSGPPPADEEALALARNWSIVQIGASKSQTFRNWRIREKELRENLEWAVIVTGDRAVSPGVAALLSELEARGVQIRWTEDKAY
jgi:hypothetical protein